MIDTAQRLARFFVTNTSPIKKHHWLFTLALILGFVTSACANPSPTATEESDDTPTTGIVSTRTATRTITPSPSASASPQPTGTSTKTAAHTPTPARTPTSTALTCTEQAGRIEEGSQRTDLLPLPLAYYVYLPPCYDDQPNRHYPVLYLIHGQNYNNDQWLRLGAAETADALISAGEIPPLIIVLPRDRSWEQPTENNFGFVLVEDLVPTIDKQYRTLSDRTRRAVGGLSRGAGWAVHLGLKYWEHFSGIGAHSLPVFWTDTNHIREWIDAIPEGQTPRIYVDIGDKDRQQIMESAVWFENLLTEENIPHEWYLNPGYHEESYWEAHLENYLRWYTASW
jgi:enterochelin esterase-like enzyme